MGIKDKIRNAEVSLWPFGMGMTVDEAINYLITPKIASTEITSEMQKQLDAHAIAIDTMHKYQKIQEIVERFKNQYDHTTSMDLMIEIKEVIEDENV